MSKLGKDIKSKLIREMIDDFNLSHGIDVTAELENILLKELDASIRKERLEKMKKILNEKN